MTPAVPSLLLVLILAAAPAGATAVRLFVAPIAESTWEVNGGPLECRLTHVIEGFGRASFVRRAGGALDFRLALEAHAPHAARVHLRALPAPWMHDAQARELGPVPDRENGSPFDLGGDRARALLAALGEGYFPTFSYRAERPATGAVRVALSAVRFQAAEEQFQACAEDLLPMDFAGIQTSSVHFVAGSTALGPVARSRLDQIATWMKLDDRIAGAVVVGHADSTGSRRQNYLLSQRRAVAVRDYLKGQGVKGDLIRVRFHGQEKPSASDKTAAGRRHNRRVDLRLLR